MRALYDSIDNKQKMCEKVNKDITFIQFFHSTRLHSTELFKIFFSLLTLQLLFLQKANWPGKKRFLGKSFEILYRTYPIRTAPKDLQFSTVDLL